MSTFKALIRPTQQKKDGTWNVKIRITHKREIKFIDTPVFVVKGQLNRKFEIKVGISAKMASRSAFKLSAHFALK